MTLMESVDAPGGGLRPDRPCWRAVVAVLVAGCVERGSRIRLACARPPLGVGGIALDAPRNEPRRTGAPAGPVRTEAAPGRVDRFHETH